MVRRTASSTTAGWYEDASHRLLHYGVDTTSGKVLFGCRCALKKNEHVFSERDLKTETHQPLDQLVDALVVVPETCCGVGVRTLDRARISGGTYGKCKRNSYLEACDVTISPLWKDRRRGLYRGICIDGWGRIEALQARSYSQVGRSSSSGSSVVDC